MKIETRVVTKIEDGWDLNCTLASLNSDGSLYFSDDLCKVVCHKNPKNLILPVGFVLTMNSPKFGTVSGIGGVNNDEVIDTEIFFKY